MDIVHTLRALLIAALVVVVPLGSTTATAASGEVVAFGETLARGTILVRTAERRLYLVLGNGHALRYSVGVGRDGRQWRGDAVIVGKFVEPNWAPPAAIRNERPGLPALIPGGTAENPMGAAALTLSGGDYAIHGTNAPGSIGGFVSHGCIRMHNSDIVDLFARVRIGTPVLVRP